MLHRTARMTPFGRQLLVERILTEGWPPATAAEMLGVSRATAYNGILGESARNWLRLGHDYLHVAIDDATRVAYVAVRPDELAESNRSASSMRPSRSSRAWESRSNA